MKLFRRKPHRHYVFRGLVEPGKDICVAPGSTITLLGESEVTILIHLDGVIEFRAPMTRDELADWAVCTELALREKIR